jgi:hypothetical protein
MIIPIIYNLELLNNNQNSIRPQIFACLGRLRVIPIASTQLHKLTTQKSYHQIPIRKPNAVSYSRKSLLMHQTDHRWLSIKTVQPPQWTISKLMNNPAFI